MERLEKRKTKKLKLTRKNIECFNLCAVSLVDIDNHKREGWLVIDYEKDEYKILPFDDIWNIYNYKFSHIKSIKHCTNGYELKK